jgi:hypothetical protein
MDEARITRSGTTATIEYADPDVPTTHLELGERLAGMSDEEVLERFNDGLAATDQLRRQQVYRALEIPIGRPQLELDETTRQWAPRGDVLRCVIHDGGPDGEPVIDIDDLVLSWSELGRMLTTYAGWGMRIELVPDDELHQRPRRRVAEPAARPRKRAERSR